MEKAIKSDVVVSAVYLNETSTNKYGTLHHHRIVMKNGDQGIYRCKSESQNWFLSGEKTDYTFHFDEYFQGNLIAPYRVNNQFNPNNKSKNSHKMTAAQEKTSANTTALNAAIQFATNLHTEDKSLMGKALGAFGDWLHKENTDKPMMTRQSVLKAAIAASAVSVLEIKTIEKVIETANKYLAFVYVAE